MAELKTGYFAMLHSVKSSKINHPIGKSLTAILTVFLMTSSPAFGTVIKPNGASASSEFSANFDAGNTIDGSGLTSNGTNISEAHADYNIDNHWTSSASSSALDQWIEWNFATPTNIGAAYFWNHRSNVIANSAGYEPTLFDLTIFDAANNVLLTLNDHALAPDSAFAQRIDFALLNNVSRVRFDVEQTQLSTPFTGLAEVAFDTQSFVSTAAVPEPSAWAMMLAGFASIGFGLRRRKERFSEILAK